MTNIINNSLKTLLTGFIILTFSHNTYADDGLIPLEHFACYSNQNSFRISPDGKHMLIQNTKKDNVCDIMQDKSEYAEDGTFDSGLLLLDLETMETKVISNGSKSDAISGSGWLNNDRIWYQPKGKRGQGTKGRVVFAVDLDGTKRKLIRQYDSWTNQFQI
jgi:hypothetical protein